MGALRVKCAWNMLSVEDDVYDTSLLSCGVFSDGNTIVLSFTSI